jgi:hypothetical protein
MIPVNGEVKNIIATYRKVSYFGMNKYYYK